MADSTNFCSSSSQTTFLDRNIVQVLAVNKNLPKLTLIEYDNFWCKQNKDYWIINLKVR